MNEGEVNDKQPPTTIIFSVLGSPHDHEIVIAKCNEKVHHCIREVRVYAWCFPAKYYEENSKMFCEFGGIRQRFAKGIAYIQYLVEKATGGEGRPFSFKGTNPNVNIPFYASGIYELNDFLDGEVRL